MNTASPLTFVFAPKLLPSYTGPSRIVKVARSNEGLVVRAAARGGGLGRAAPLITLALKRTWVEVFKAFAAETPTIGRRPFGLHIRGKIVLAMIFEFVCLFL